MAAAGAAASMAMFSLFGTGCAGKVPVGSIYDPSVAPGVWGDKRPNFVFIFLDDAGWSDFGCYGGTYAKTPNIDRMAKEGTLFTSFYVNAPVCSPSRAAFMTGKYPIRVGLPHITMTGDQARQYGSVAFVDPKIPMVTSILHETGYRTGHFGKWHLGTGKDSPSLSEYGVDDHRTFLSSDPTWKLPYSELLSVRPKLIFDEAIRFIEENTDRPFYLNVWSVLPHSPLNPNEELVKDYDLAAGRMHRQRYGVPGPVTAETYFASVKAVDTQVGRLLAKLDELGLSENTVVILSSDNGPEVLDVAPHASVGTTGPFRGRKRSLYEGGVRMPFIVRCLGKVPTGKVNDTSVVTGVDWLPTVCTLAGVPMPHTWLDGENVADILLGSDRRRNKPIMWEWRSKVYGATIHRSPMLSIRDGDWKLLMNPDESRVELYNIPNDPSEVDNVANEHPFIVRRLKKKVMEIHNSLPPGPVQPEAGKKDYPWPGQAAKAEGMMEE